MDKEKLNELLLQANALRDTMDRIYNSDPYDPENYRRFGSFYIFMRKYNQLVEEAKNHLKKTKLLDYFNLDKFKGTMHSSEEKYYFDLVFTNISLIISTIENKLGAKEKKINSLRNFLEANIRKAVFESPKKEVEIQNIVEQLLIGWGMNKGIDYDREKGRVKVSAKETIPDFIFPTLGLALEIKLLKSNKGSISKLIDQINADIRSYSKSYSQILFLVYDLGFIRDEDEFKKDLDNDDNILVIIKKH